MHFKAGSKEPKATLEIGDKTYKIYAPLLGQADAFTEKFTAVKEDTAASLKLMREYMCELGSIPMPELMKIENEMFYELYSYVVNGVKKS